MFYHDYHCRNTQKYFRLTQQNTDINNDKFRKMGTIVEFRLLVLDSLKYSSKAESPINRSAKAVISRNLTTTEHDHLFIYFVFLFLFLFFIFIFIFYFLFFYFFHMYTENRHYRLICIAIVTVVIGWSEWIKNIYLLLRRLNLAIVAYFDKHY